MDGKCVVTVETNQGDEVICTLNDVGDTSSHHKHKEITTYQEACEWMKDSHVTFHWCKYRLYKLVEITPALNREGIIR